MNMKYISTGNRDENSFQSYVSSFDKLGASNGYYIIQVFALLFVSNVTSSRISVENVTKGVGKHDPDICAAQLYSVSALYCSGQCLQVTTARNQHK